MPITLSNLAAAVRAFLPDGPMDDTPDRYVLPVGVRGLGATGIALTASTGWFVYMGRANRNWTPAAFSWLCRTAPTGTGQHEVWLGTSPNAPIYNTTQTLTRLWSASSTSIMSITAMTRFTSGLPQINSGVHLWAGIRASAWTAQPSCEGGSYSCRSGGALTWASATDLTQSGGASIASGTLTLPAVSQITHMLRLER